MAARISVGTPRPYTRMDSPIPAEIRLHRKSRVMEPRSSGGKRFGLRANRDALWAAYPTRMQTAGAKRE